MRLVIALFAVAAAAIGAAWYGLGRPVPMPQSGLAPGGKLYCLSYAPFRGGQTPLDPATAISPAQIDDDLARLSQTTGCVRTYSADFGIERTAELAGRHGLKVLQGLWLSSIPKKNDIQIETAVALATRHRDTIAAVIVGNEVLLRGEMSAVDLATTIRAVKARVPVPVTYADVWEFWLRNRELASAVDFITIHILPYWEDKPIAARDAAAHVDSIRRQVAEAFPGKDIVIGEVGWPSAGRMREGALPSRVNQARVIHDVLARANAGNYRVNIIEAFDQPWKRALEGTVGGHWGLFADATRQFKFAWGAPVSNHPYWPWQAAGGIAFAALVFAAGVLPRGQGAPAPRVAVGIALCAIAGGATIGWTIANVPLESLGAGGWLRSLSLATISLVAPPLAAAALRADIPLPRFSRIIGPAAQRLRDPLPRALGLVAMAVTVLAILVALGLVFDPRYRDFSYAPLTAAIAPLAVLGVFVKRPAGAHGVAEIAACALLAPSAVFILWNETVANWQSLWLCAALVLLAVTLARIHDARS